MTVSIPQTIDRLAREPITLVEAVRLINVAAGERRVSYDTARNAYLDGKPIAIQAANGRFSVGSAQFESLLGVFAPDLLPELDAVA